jgi:hypothetical protein
MRRGEGLLLGRALLLLLGIWLAVSPWLFGYAVHAHAVQDTITGVLLVVAAICSPLFGRVTALPLWMAMMLGIWTVGTPMMFGQAGESFSANNDVIVGLLTVLAAEIALGSRARMRLFASGADPQGALGQTSLW